MSRWTHATGADHEPDPHYNGNGLPAWWTCHAKTAAGRCDGELRLDGAKVPIVTPVRKTDPAPEPPLSAQP